MMKKALIGILALSFLMAQPVLASHRPSERTTDIINVPLFIEDADGNDAPTDPGTLIYETRFHNPILAPDGHHMTFEEFNAVEGRASVRCGLRGTRVSMHLSGLIPKGVYTIWNVTFKPPGFDGTLDSLFTNLIGIGALGSSVGSDNTFKATSSGRGHIMATTPEGPLSMLGNIARCALADEFEWHLVGAYHIDGQSHGPTPGATVEDDGSFVEQFGFIFKP